MTENGVRRALNNVAVLKTIMMFLVVLGHASIVFTMNEWGGIVPHQENEFFAFLSRWLSTFHTHAFVFASGYLFAYNRYEKNKYRSPKKDISKRVLRILVPYIFISVLWAIPADLILQDLTFSQIIKNYVFAINPAQLWFLIMLFSVYLIFYFTSDYLMKIPFWVGIAVFVTARLALLIMHKYLPLGVFGINNTISYAIFYYLGMRFSCKKYFENFNVARAILLVISEIVFVLIWYNKGYIISNEYLAEILEVVLNINGILMVRELLMSLPLERIVSNALFKNISSCSMGIFLLHQQILYVSMRLLNLEFILPIFFVLLNFAVSVMLSWGLTLILRKIKFGRLILGDA